MKNNCKYLLQDINNYCWSISVWTITEQDFRSLIYSQIVHKGSCSVILHTSTGATHDFVELKQQRNRMEIGFNLKCFW